MTVAVTRIPLRAAALFGSLWCVVHSQEADQDAEQCQMHLTSRGEAAQGNRENKEVQIAGTQLLQHEVVFSSKLSMDRSLTGKSSCGDPPQLDGAGVSDTITGTSGVLLLAMKDMRCTAAVEAALQAKGATATTKYFTSPSSANGGLPTPEDTSAADVWKWLHCSYGKDPNDDNMHSYVFIDGTYVGNGFQAAEKITSGTFDDKLGETKSCEEQFPNEANVVKNYKDNSKNRVLLFGWQGCPCTGIAEARFAAASVCYEGRTWAQPNSKMMNYLQCESGDAQRHSFVFFRSGAANDAPWDFVGTGFDLAEDAMTEQDFNTKVQSAVAITNCTRASVTRNVYGTAVEECRLPSDGSQQGSWMDDGKCTETVGGIHQICIQAGTLPHDFSMNTYQSSDWSESRTNKSHCICVGAWSTYMTEEKKHPDENNKITPRCKSIPETVLTKEYMGNWKNWNGFVANVGTGLGQLVERCLTVDDITLKCGLKERFQKLNDEEELIKNATELDNVRSQLQQVQCPS